MAFQWGSEVDSQDVEVAELFRKLTIEDMQAYVPPSQTEPLSNNNDDDDDDNDNNIDYTVMKQTLEDQLGSFHYDYKDPKNNAKGKEEEEEEEGSCSEELAFIHDAVRIPPRMRTVCEFQATCLDRWDDLYPENSDPNDAAKFENNQLDWDASWYSDKINSILSRLPQRTNDTTLIPAGIVKDYAVAVCCPFKRDIETKEKLLFVAFKDYMIISIQHAWDITTVNVLEEYLKFAQECGAIDKKHTQQVSKVFKSQRRLIAEMTEKLKIELEEKKISKEEEEEMATRIMDQYDHPIRKDKTKMREVDAMAIHELRMITDNKGSFPVYNYTTQESMKELVKTLKNKDSKRKQKNRKRHDRKRKQNPKQKPVTVAVAETPKSPLNTVKGDIMICPFGGYKNKRPNWETCKNRLINTTGVFHLGTCGDLAGSIKNGIVIHSIPSGTKTEEFQFPEEQFTEIRQIFVDDRFLCCIFEGSCDDQSINPCQAIIINRKTKETKVVTVTTKGQITAICTEPTKESIWLGFSNGIAYCIQWKDSKIDDSIHSIVVLSIISPITKMYRVGRQLHCQIICGINSVDVIPMKEETINAMLSRAGDPIFTRLSMMSAFARRGTIRVSLLRNHNISIGQTAAAGIIKVLVPPEHLSTTEIREVVKESEDKKGQIVEEEVFTVPKITAFPLEQYVKIDVNKISVLYSDCTVRIVYTTPKTRKEKLAEIE